ncbi:MAG: hypothetical protein KKD38_06775 [Candidatus Delongbacteria bacterium]|nr:hypothetical protein [Candidatus Delongbacteria bacterium]MCG2760632.1 hypothetical protein [Candidatus Delongbacteria bacterium]
MKKLLTILSLLGVLSLSAFAQDCPQANKDIKPGIADKENPGTGMCPMHKGKGFGKGKSMRNDNDGCDRFGPMMMEQLDLTADQINRIHQIKVKYKKLGIDLKAELKKLEIDKQEAMKEMNFDKAKEVTKKMADVRTKDQISNIDEKSEMTKVLSKEQIEKLKEFHKAPGKMKHKIMNKDK